MVQRKNKKVRTRRNPESEKGDRRTPKCVAVADAGIETGGQFARLMSALIGDVATGRIDTRRANAMCNAGGKLLKVVELQQKYGTPVPANNEKCSKDFRLV